MKTRELLKNKTIYCGYGCGQLAKYQFKNGNYSCTNNPSKCPAINPPKQKIIDIPKCRYCGKILVNHIRKIGNKLRCPACKALGKGNPSKASEEEKKKRAFKVKQTIIKRYGVENVSQLDSVKEKKKQTLQKNYGVDSPLQSKEIYQRAIATNRKMYGTDYYTQNIEVKRKMRKYHEYESTVAPLYKQSFCVFCGQATFIHKHDKDIFAVCDDCYDDGLFTILEETELYNRNKKQKETNLKKYGTEHFFQSSTYIEKAKKTNLEKYGVENPFASEDIKDKIRITNLKKFGVENPSQAQVIKDKKIQTSLKNYGTDHPLQNKDKFAKWQSDFADKYDGATSPYKVAEFKEKMSINIKKNYFSKIIFKIKEKKLKLVSDYSLEGGYYKKIIFRCMKCGLEFEDNIYSILMAKHGCPKCDPLIHLYVSKPELNIVEFLNSLDIHHIIRNSRRIIPPKELDLYLPDYNLAIEYHGLYWHSTNFNEDIDHKYHRNKYELCKEKGIRLIQIFEDEWILNEELVKSKLTHILNKSKLEKIYARKCQIKEIDATTKNNFLRINHIQGEDKSVIKLGAFFKNQLVSVMTFSHGNISKGSKNIKDVWELNRFASHSNYIIIGIASKLLKYFERNYIWKEIFTYADLRWSVGNVYDKLDFKYLYDTKPNYFYTKGMERIHRYNLRKRSYEPKDAPEWILRLEEGYHRIWDSGHSKFNKENIS